MNRTAIFELYKNTGLKDGDTVTVGGWVKTAREQKTLGFLELNDGSSFKNIQIVLEQTKVENFKEAANASVGSSVLVTGQVVLTPNAKQPFEINAQIAKIMGGCDSDYPLQKKKHSLEFLRTIPHLRCRSNTFNAVFRIRSETAFAIHSFFNQNGFLYVHTPIITGSDCEGAGAMFKVSTLDAKNPPLDDQKNIDYSKDFFGRETSLTVSGQLEAEGMAIGLSNVYTFGPTFRAENSNTPRHAAEFWMVEPEMAFADINDNMDVGESMIKYVISHLLEKCPDELNFFNSFYDKGLIERLTKLKDSEFGRISYTEAIEQLMKHNDEFEYKVSWGVDLQTEHERYLTEKIYGKPLFVINYPKEIKSFYMRLNEDGKTVAAMDMLVPSVGELIGGSQREERYQNLVARIEEMGLEKRDYEWYLDLRRYGSVYHSGFGLGFERLLMYVTGISNIRDVTLYPRTAGGF